MKPHKLELGFRLVEPHVKSRLETQIHSDEKESTWKLSVFIGEIDEDRDVIVCSLK